MQKTVLTSAGLFSYFIFSTFSFSDDIPAAPITATPSLGYAESYLLENELIKAVIIPETGRIASISFKGSENLLTQRVAKTADKDSNWINYGGELVYPVHQSRWTESFGSNWPPPKALDGHPWEAQAWKGNDGTQNCKLVLHYPAPLNAKCTRIISLHPNTSSLIIRQRLERTEASKVPLCLWNIAQVQQPDLLLLPTSPASSFKQGFIKLSGEDIPSSSLHACEGAVLIRFQDIEGALASDAAGKWAAALHDNILLSIQISDSNAQTGSCPDTNSPQSISFNSQKAYAELKAVSNEIVLQPGQFIENTITIHCSRVQENKNDCFLTAFLLEQLKPAVSFR